MFKIHEFSSASGELSSVYLRTTDDQLLVVSDEGHWPLPSGALRAVLTRYGAPFDAEARSTVIASLQLSEREWLRHVRHLAGYDVIARDYLVYERPGDEALCALAATVTAALLHLAQAQVALG
ncbi:MAG TPA: hypothetical protein VER11_08530 [Polyangiaceae bacterium]|nr:hypothetical protein [Polyangiaceae bacterium]